MKIAIVGAGAVGGYVGVKLALAGERVTFLARGANREAIRNHGIRLLLAGGTELRTGNRRCDDAERHSVLVLPRARRSVRRTPCARGRFDRRLPAAHSARASDRLCGLPGLG